ncbi:MAG: hypothetical protein RLZ77_1562 [Bacteroidota bacterium]|jgi:hypothetical protein
MKNFALFFILAMTLVSCVQKAYDRKVELTLRLPKKQVVQSVVVYGNGNPLSWQQPLALQPVIADSVYKVTFTSTTGYLQTELKFAVNEQWELNNQPNRILKYNTKGTTKMEVVFDQQ